MRTPEASIVRYLTGVVPLSDDQSMDIWALVVSIIAPVATVAAAAVAVWQAKIARDARDDARKAQAESESAAAESVALAKKANDTFERQAEAQEEANAIARANLPTDEVRWEYEQIRGARYILRNVGTRAAIKAVIEDITEPVGFVRPEESSRFVRPGESVEFTVLSIWGSPTPAFRASWKEDGSEEVHADDTRMVIR